MHGQFSYGIWTCHAHHVHCESKKPRYSTFVAIRLRCGGMFMMSDDYCKFITESVVKEF